MNEYQHEPKLAWWHYLVPVLVFLALGVAGGIEPADGQPQDHGCEHPVDETTAGRIIGGMGSVCDE